MALFWILTISTFVFSVAQNPCTTPDQKSGECMRLNNCAALRALARKKPLLDNERAFLSQSQCGYDTRPLVCCAIESSTPANQGSPSQTVPAGPSRTTSLLPKPGICGIDSETKVVNGNRTHIDEFIWMALLQYERDGERAFHCGGSLINNRYVLTAAHCVRGAPQKQGFTLVQVRLGEWDVSTDVDCEINDCSDPVRDVPIEEMIVHENYNADDKRQYDDIALLRLTDFIEYTPWIKPACLPAAENFRDETFYGKTLIVSGWGRTETGQYSSLKLRAELDVITLQQCNEKYITRGITLMDTQLCAGGTTIADSCGGDSGGPLMGRDRTNPRRPYTYVAGLVSFGLTSCGTPGWPGVYTKVSKYVNWIESKLRA